jgi:pimeloyl-ACP methyl ester carboxylesterase
VGCLVLCGTPGGVWTVEVEAALAGIGERLREAGGLAGPGGAALGAAFKARAPGRAFLYDQISSFNTLPDLPAMLAQIGSVRIAPDDLSGFRIPTLVVAGHDDVLFPLDAMKSVAAAIPGAELVEFETAGHSAYFEEPERFNQVVSAFVARHAGGAGALPGAD